ncbi:hypothetical protein [Fischerella sp. FACHB-380]|uniref:hypothetical protein n=1 Tax=Fischerella sp. FACHB-380 TaxID=2692799 RepID=UPI0030D83B59
MAGQAFQVTDALKDKKQQQDFSYSSALKTPIFTKRDRAQLILIFSAVIKVKGKPSLSYIPLVTPSVHRHQKWCRYHQLGLLVRDVSKLTRVS